MEPVEDLLVQPAPHSGSRPDQEPAVGGRLPYPEAGRKNPPGTAADQREDDRGEQRLVRCVLRSAALLPHFRRRDQRLRDLPQPVRTDPASRAPPLILRSSGHTPPEIVAARRPHGAAPRGGNDEQHQTPGGWSGECCGRSPATRCCRTGGSRARAPVGNGSDEPAPPEPNGDARIAIHRLATQLASLLLAIPKATAVALLCGLLNEIKQDTPTASASAK